MWIKCFRNEELRMQPNFLDLFRIKVDLTIEYYNEGHMERFLEECISINALYKIKGDIIKSDIELDQKVKDLMEKYKKINNNKGFKK